MASDDLHEVILAEDLRQLRARTVPLKFEFRQERTDVPKGIVVIGSLLHTNALSPRRRIGEANARRIIPAYSQRHVIGLKPVGSVDAPIQKPGNG
jgi:hypothetical protein